MIDFVINPIPLPFCTMEIVFPMPVADVFIHVIQHVILSLCFFSKCALPGKGDPHRTLGGFIQSLGALALAG